MEENAKSQNGGYKTLSILIFKLNVLLYFSAYELRVYILWYVKNIFCFSRLIICVVCSFTRTFSTFYIGLLFTRTGVLRHESFI